MRGLTGAPLRKDGGLLDEIFLNPFPFSNHHLSTLWNAGRIAAHQTEMSLFEDVPSYHVCTKPTSAQTVSARGCPVERYWPQEDTERR